MIIDMFGFRVSILLFVFCVFSLLFVCLFLVSCLFLDYLDFGEYISFRSMYWLIFYCGSKIFNFSKFLGCCIQSRISVVIGERDRLSWAYLILTVQILPFKKCNFVIFHMFFQTSIYRSFKITGFCCTERLFQYWCCFSPKQ